MNLIMANFSDFFESPNGTGWEILAISLFSIVGGAILFGFIWAIHNDRKTKAKGKNQPVKPHENFDIFLPTYIPEDFDPYPDSNEKSYQDGIEQWDVSYIERGEGRDFPYIEVRISRGLINDPELWESKIRDSLQKEINCISVCIEIEVPQKVKSNFWKDEPWDVGKFPRLAANWKYQNINFRLDAYKTPLEEIEKVIASMVH
jgi:hypothetical protein